MTEQTAAATAVYGLPLDAPNGPAPSGASSSRLDVDRVLLRRNAVWFCRLRWIVVAFLVLAAVAAAGAPGLLERLGLRLGYQWPLITAVFLGLLNVAYVVLVPSEHAWPGQVRLHLWVQIIADLAVLSVVVHLLGSVETAAAFMYLFHIIFACVFFPPRESLAVTAIAVLLYCGWLLLESTGVAGQTTVVLGAPARPANFFFSGPFWGVHMLPLLAIWGAIWYLASWLAGALREREADLAVTNVRLKASGEERATHMLQTTHQLKAPFAAIHANAQLLLDGACGPLPEGACPVVERIAARCEMLSQQILDMLQLSNLRSEAQSAIAPAPLDVAETVCASIARVEPAAGLRGIAIVAELEPVTVSAVEDHLRMALDNVLTNAVLYSYDGGTVTVTCRRGPDGAAGVAVRDQGIGIPVEKLPHVFEEFFRTREAVRHNKASTGLGLAIVRDAARISGIDVQVESGPGWGTCVSFTIPINRTEGSNRPWRTS